MLSATGWLLVDVPADDAAGVGTAAVEGAVGAAVGWSAAWALAKLADSAVSTVALTKAHCFLRLSNW